MPDPEKLLKRLIELPSACDRFYQRIHIVELIFKFAKTIERMPLHLRQALFHFLNYSSLA